MGETPRDLAQRFLWIRNLQFEEDHVRMVRQQTAIIQDEYPWYLGLQNSYPESYRSIRARKLCSGAFQNVLPILKRCFGMRSISVQWDESLLPLSKRLWATLYLFWSSYVPNRASSSFILRLLDGLFCRGSGYVHWWPRREHVPQHGFARSHLSLRFRHRMHEIDFCFRVDVSSFCLVASILRRERLASGSKSSPERTWPSVGFKGSEIASSKEAMVSFP